MPATQTPSPVTRSLDDLLPWRGKINHTSLAVARDLLDIEWPVRIRRTSGRRTRGTHRLRKVNGRYEHHITVSTYLTVERASRTLWHELTHASQVERSREDPESIRNKMLAACKYSRARPGTAHQQYLNSPFEVEARAAEDFDSDYRLTRPY